ncbi:MAG: hypothetical protein OXI71_10545 [Gemmatimonadota bacterium]|nr:hypothetical protein [Gemmatimonadota bacterium]
MDDKDTILREYRKQFDQSSTQAVGFQFLLWIHDNQANSEYCRKVLVTHDETLGFAEFPDHEDLETFDWDDRVFVAVALGSCTGAVILNATDTDWWDHREALNRHGVKIDFVCPELMRTS